MELTPSSRRTIRIAQQQYEQHIDDLRQDRISELSNKLNIPEDLVELIWDDWLDEDSTNALRKLVRDVRS